MVANLCLGGGGVDGLGQLIGLLQALGQLDAAHLAGLLVACPAASSDISTNDALNRVAGELGLAEELRHILHIHAQHVVGQQIAGVIEPELAHLGEHGALFGDLVFQDDVKRRNAVGGNHDQAVAIVVDLADFELSHNQTLHFSMFSAAQQRSTVLTLLFYHTAARFKRNRIKEKRASFVFLS